MYNIKSKVVGKMRRALFVLFVPLVAFAICENCDSFRSSLLTRNQDITAQVQSMQSDFSYILVNANNLRISLENEDSAYSYDAGNLYTQAEIGQAKCSIALEMLASNRVDILSFNCDCDSSGGCECAGILTNCYESLQYIEGYTRETAYGMETLLHDLETFKSAVVDGFSSVTNILDFFSDQFFSDRSSPISNPSSALYLMSLSRVGNTPISSSLSSSSLNPSASHMGYLAVYARSLYWQSTALTTIANYLYPFIYTDFPVLTNTVGTLTCESTNFFSFFRGEVGVHGVLEDWTEQDGSYYDFLTNHYIQVVTGGTLSGNQSQKTNWFARVETLLASLVFTDSESTNTVDSSTADQQSKEITSHFEEVNTLASNVVQDFSEKSEDIVELFRSWCQQFDSAALPSHVVLFTVPSEGEDLVIQFSLSDTPEVVAMVEGMRAITTFCWASVGIFLLYKFLVWSARCVFVACQFIYKAVSAVFR